MQELLEKDLTFKRKTLRNKTANFYGLEDLEVYLLTANSLPKEIDWCQQNLKHLQRLYMMNRSVIASSVAIKEGDLEKRSDSFLQLWKKRRCVLTADGLHLYTDSRKRSKAKILRFDSLTKLECVERKGERVYFTLVTIDGQEIDFRCRERSRWNAEITLALVGFQNRKAVQELRARKEHQARDAGERLRSWGL